jgi:cation diffusion facilitator CzcD-associated flavoprotein CzcO
MPNKHSAKPRIAVFGSGVSGIATGVALKKAGFSNFEMFERESDVGGTWNNHRYPGLCCDVPAHIYSFSFAGNPHWSLPYPPRAEISAYFRKVAERFDLIRHIRFNTAVRSAEYDESRQEWNVALENGETRAFDFVIGALGFYNTPQLPAIPGVDEFQGESWHSSRWPEDLDLTGKRVAIVGTAASSVQITPEVAKVAEQLHVFQRTPNWIFPRDQTPFTPAQRTRFARFPILRKLHRWQIYYREQMPLKKAFWGDRDKIREFQDGAKAYLDSVIADPVLREKLTPNFVLGCKRVLLTSEYYPTFNRPNVELVTDGINKITARAVVTSDGVEREVDAIIYCTGYLFPHFEGPVPIVGKGGQTLAEAFAGGPEAHAAGTGVPGFPNYFIVNGPNGVFGFGSAVMSAEIQAEYVARVIKYVTARHARSIEPRKDVTAKYNAHMQAVLSTTNFASTTNCPSFYHDENGRVAFFYRGTAFEMWRELARVKKKNYVIQG